MEKQLNPPPYPGPQMDPGAIIYPGHPPAFSPSADQSALIHPQPPTYGFSPAHIAVQPTVVPVVRQVVLVTTLTDVPGHITCPHCMTDIVTETEHFSGLLTWLICGILAFFVCWLCCCIPFCVDSCKDVKHSCPNCKNVIRIYKRM